MARMGILMEYRSHTNKVWQPSELHTIDSPRIEDVMASNCLYRAKL